MLPLKILKSKASNDAAILDHISAEICPFFCFWDPEQGGGGGRAPAAPPSGSATESCPFQRRERSISRTHRHH